MLLAINLKRILNYLIFNLKFQVTHNLDMPETGSIKNVRVQGISSVHNYHI